MSAARLKASGEIDVPSVCATPVNFPSQKVAGSQTRTSGDSLWANLEFCGRGGWSAMSASRRTLSLCFLLALSELRRPRHLIKIFYGSGNRARARANRPSSLGFNFSRSLSCLVTHVYLYIFHRQTREREREREGEGGKETGIKQAEL